MFEVENENKQEPFLTNLNSWCVNCSSLTVFSHANGGGFL